MPTQSENADIFTWTGPNGGSWQSSANWTDTTTTINPALLVPGTLTPVIITGPANSTPVSIVDGGSAASIGLTNSVNLAGTYAVGGAVTIGTTDISSGLAPTPTLTSSALELSGGLITAGTMNVWDGGLTLDDGTTIDADGSVAIGAAAQGIGAISLSSGATLSTVDILVNAGTLSDDAGQVAIANGLTVATAAGAATSSMVFITDGGTMTVGGNMAAPDSGILIDGSGSKLVVNGALTANGGGVPDIYVTGLGDIVVYTNNITAAEGGFVRLGGLAMGSSVSGANSSPAGMSVDGTSTIEIGAAGGAAAGAITLDTGKIITSTATASLSGNFVDNGTLDIVSGVMTQRDGDVSGSGVVRIGAGATWQVDDNVAATDTIAMLNAGGVLSIGNNGPSNSPTSFVLGATITGFQAGDTIAVGQNVTAAKYSAGTGGNPGTLVLSNGTTTIETLHLAGNFAGENFRLNTVFNADTTATTYVTVGAAAPTISGLLADQPGSDNAVVAPFAAIAISDADPGAAVGASVVLTSGGTATDADGVLSGAGLTKTGVGSYTLAAASLATLTTELRGLTFTPTDHQVAPGNIVTTMFGLTVANGGATATASTRVAVTAQDSVPQVTPLSAGQVAAYGGSFTPFAGIAVTDPDLEATTSAGIVLTSGGIPNDANGTLTGSFLVKTGVGYYSLAATSPANLSAELKALTFTGTAPGAVPGSHVTTEFDLTVVAEGAKTADVSTTVTFTPPELEFDAAYYLANNPDVAAAGVDPLTHYETYGWKEARNPDSEFNTQYYLNQNPDVAAAGIDPLIHYEQAGWKEGRDPSIDFSTSQYLKANPDVAAVHIDPLSHYLQFGAPEGRMAFIAQPHGVGPQDPLVENAYYFAQNPDVAAAGLNPFTHYDEAGWHEGRNPDALFDTSYYLQHNPDVAAADVDPLLHYEAFGWKEGRDPSAQFSSSAYLAANPDVRAAGINPLVQYELYGKAEGRAIHAV